MEIEIRLFATFRNGRDKKVCIDIDAATPGKLLAEIGINQEDVALLLVNGRDGKYNQELYEQDYISVFPPVGGG